jgi:hypothetical protein
VVKNRSASHKIGIQPTIDGNIIGMPINYSVSTFNQQYGYYGMFPSTIGIVMGIGHQQRGFAKKNGYV